MEEQLKYVDELINNSRKIPNDIKNIVKAICKGYIRESNGQIPIEGIINVCNTTFEKIDENNESFRKEDKRFAETETNYDENCNVIHKINYLNDSNYIKLISILTHELGHVITESKPCEIIDGIYPYAKRTTTIYINCFYKENQLLTQGYYGYRMADGFLESISTKIFESKYFRQELLNYGYDLKDYIYKDERIFPSRSYDEYKACFELFDYIMNGKLFEFSCKTFESNKELYDYFVNNRINIIFKTLDKSNDAMSNLKKYETLEPSEDFNNNLEDYKNKKSESLMMASVLSELYGKENDEKYKKLLKIYENTLEKQKLLPLNEENTKI